MRASWLLACGACCAVMCAAGAALPSRRTGWRRENGLYNRHSLAADPDFSTSAADAEVLGRARDSPCPVDIGAHFAE